MTTSFHSLNRIELYLVPNNMIAVYTTQVNNMIINNYTQDGTTHLVWMVGGGPLFAVEGLLVSQARAKGMQRVQLLKPETPQVRLPNKVSKIDVLASKVNVPAEETTYWCHVMKIPLDLSFKHHIVRVNIMSYC